MPVAGNMIWAVKVWIDYATHKLQVGPPTYYPKDKITTNLDLAAEVLSNSNGAVVYLKFFGDNVRQIKERYEEHES